jgi:predicted dehydrogenase
MTRAAIAGTGFIARVHAAALRELGIDVTAVCGRTRARAEAFGIGRPYASVEDLLDAEKVDVLHVCTPNDVHANQALAALERGVHVICEKPLATTSAESARMCAVAAERGLVGATCYHARSYPLVEHLRAERAAGALGDVQFVHGRYLCDDVLFPASGWRLDPGRSGPSYAVGDLGTHVLDLAEHVSGLRIVAVLADFRSFATEPLEDYAALLLRFEGGQPGSVVVSAGAGGRKNQLLLEIEGTRAGATWDQEEPNSALVRPADAPVQRIVRDPLTNAASARRLSRFPAGHGEGYGDAFRNLFTSIYRAVAGETHDPYPTFADGHHGVALVEAAVASSRENAWMPVEA